MKKIIKLTAMLCGVILSATLLSACNSNKEVLRVYNWGDYIAPDVISTFEKESGIKVVYDTFETNEDMYLKIKSSKGYTYDMAFPSDYLIDKMLKEDRLAEINYDNIPNYKGMDEKFIGLSYDPENKFSVPYMWGTVCIAYDPEQITEPVDSWNILWNEKYAKKIFMIDSERDSIGVALMKLGYSLNTRDKDELSKAKDELLAQKPLILAYTSDDIKDKLIGREGAMGVIWSCDIGIIREQDTSISYSIPKEGTNLWFDAAVIFKNAENKENAEKFINFLCRPDIAQQNADYLGSASPITEAANNQDEIIKNDPIVNPSKADMDKYEIFKNMTDISTEYEKIWSDVKAS